MRPLLRRAFETVTTEMFRSLAISESVALMEPKNSTFGRLRGPLGLSLTLNGLALNFTLDSASDFRKNRVHPASLYTPDFPLSVRASDLLGAIGTAVSAAQ